MFPYHVIPNKQTEKVTSNVKRPGKSEVVLSVFSLSIKLKENLLFWVNTNIHVFNVDW